MKSHKHKENVLFIKFKLWQMICLFCIEDRYSKNSPFSEINSVEWKFIKKREQSLNNETFGTCSESRQEFWEGKFEVRWRGLIIGFYLNEL